VWVRLEEVREELFVFELGCGGGGAVALRLAGVEGGEVSKIASESLGGSTKRTAYDQ